MTSLATLAERLRRASAGADPLRDAAVVLSEFLDDGGLEPVDDPFHPARRDPAAGSVAPLTTGPDSTVVLIRSTPPPPSLPQRHGVPVAVAMLTGRLEIEVFDESCGDELGAVVHTTEVGAGEVTVLDADVIHRLRFRGEDPGLAIHAALGDLRSVSRSRWVDGRWQVVEGSGDYPLTEPGEEAGSAG